MKKRIINSENPLFKILSNHIIDYPTPLNINYAWSFGSLAGIFFGLQLVTGIFLAMHYTPHIDLAFASVEHIMRDVKNGWLLRYMHSNGASMVFIMIYIHIGKALYYRSYTHKRKHLFFSGILIFLLMMGTAFIGYVLPWGQMSFWGATVITNLITAVPFVGESIAQWVWGGFSVGNPTLTRFFSLHYLLPFIVTAVIFLHLTILHTEGSSNPLGINSSLDKISFYPYFVLKDTLSLAVALFFYVILVHFYPNMLGHSDNYIPANPLVTPTHIVPEWYFLPFYAILRAIPNKIGGVLAMLGAILILFVIPFVDQSPIRTPVSRPIFKFFFWFFVADFFLLGFLGGHPAEEPYITASRWASLFYFSYFLIILPITSVIEWELTANLPALWQLSLEQRMEELRKELNAIFAFSMLSKFPDLGPPIEFRDIPHWKSRIKELARIDEELKPFHKEERQKLAKIETLFKVMDEWTTDPRDRMSLIGKAGHMHIITSLPLELTEMKEFPRVWEYLLDLEILPTMDPMLLDAAGFPEFPNLTDYVTRQHDNTGDERKES